MILGGLTEDGKAADNQLSQLILQSAINAQTIQPTLSIWYDKSLSEEFQLKAMDCVKTGLGFPAFFNFKVYAEHELAKSAGKVTIEDLRKYAAMGGCTEPVMEGMSHGVVQAGFINHMKLFELAWYGGKDPRTGIVLEERKVPQDRMELFESYKYFLAKAVRNWQRYWNYVMAAHHDTCNLIYSSVLVRDCIETGRSLGDSGARVNTAPTTLSTGMVNVVNAFAAIRSLGSDIDIEEIKTACEANWQGYELLHKKVRNAPKWGNNDDEADDIYEELFDFYCVSVEKQTNYLGERYDPSMLAISTHGPFGKVCCASPDGRLDGEHLADGVTSPSPGTDRQGPFAVLHSAGKLDHRRIRGGLHNMKFAPMTIKGETGSRKVLQLIDSYFQSNAFQIQFNVVDSNMLKDAQKHPEKYRSVIVRVSGFSAYFVELGETMQNEVIERTELGI